MPDNTIVARVMVASDDAAGGTDTSDGGGGDDKDKKNDKTIIGHLSKMKDAALNQLRTTVGVQFTTAAMLKQSQIFTGSLGSIFQILGALVDVILAPFLPIIVPGIRLMADMIPRVREAAQNIYDWMATTFGPLFKSIGDKIPDSWKEWTMDKLAYAIVFLFFAKFIGIGRLIRLAFGILKLIWRSGAGLLRWATVFRRMWVKEGLKAALKEGIKKLIFKIPGVKAISGLFTKFGIGKGLKTLGKGLMKGLSKIGVGKVGKAVGLAGAAALTGGRAIPVLGSLVEAGVTLYKAGKDIKEMRAAGASWKQTAAMAGTRLAVGGGIAAVSAGDVSGIATGAAGIAAHLVMDKARDKWIANIKVENTNNTQVVSPQGETVDERKTRTTENVRASNRKIQNGLGSSVTTESLTPPFAFSGGGL